MRLPVSLIATGLLLAGCSPFTMEVTSRSDGNVYKGTAHKTVAGEAVLSVTLNNVTYSGHLDRVNLREFQAFLLASSHGTNEPVNGQPYMATLRAEQGGLLLRCGFANEHQAEDKGICVDASHRLYDVAIRSTIERSRTGLLHQLN